MKQKAHYLASEERRIGNNNHLAGAQSYDYRSIYNQTATGNDQEGTTMPPINIQGNKNGLSLSQIKYIHQS